MTDKRQRVANALEPEGDLALQPVHMMKLFAPATMSLLISYSWGHHRHKLTGSVFVNVVTGTAATETVHLIPQRKKSRWYQQSSPE